MKIFVINGPNLNLTGTREPHIYGTESFESWLPSVRAKHPGMQIEYFQSNVEGEIINALQKAAADKTSSGIVLNAGAYTHTSIAIADRAADAIADATGLPRKAFTYLRSHGGLDVEHVKFFKGLMDRISDPAEQDVILHAASVFFRLYGDIFRSLPALAASSTAKEVAA